MGLFITARIIPTMPDSDWESAWQQTCKILRNYPVPLMALKWTETPYGKRIMYSRQAVVQENHWRVEGDAVSRLTGETFLLQRHLADYRKSTYPQSIFANINPSGQFIESNGLTIFDSKTQGYPFHEAMLAIAMLLEHRFPNLCYIRGDFSRAQAHRVRAWLRELLDEPVPLPYCLDAARLWNSLEGQGLEGEALVRVFHALFRSEGGEEERWLLAQSRNLGIKFIAGQLAYYHSIFQWGALNQMRGVLEAMGDIEVLLDIIAAANSKKEAEDGKGKPSDLFTLTDVLQALIQHSVAIPKWQRGALSEFGKAMRGDLNIEQTFGSLFLRMSGMAPTWNVSIHADDLLAAFVRREPQNAEKFAAILDAETAALCKDNAQFEAWLEKHPRQHGPQGEEMWNSGTPSFDVPDRTSFSEYVRDNAEQQRVKVSNPDSRAVVIGEKMRKLIANPDCKDFFASEAAETYLCAMTRISTERGPLLTEDAWLEIDATTDLATLRILCALISSCSNTADSHLHTRIFLEDSRLWPTLVGA